MNYGMIPSSWDVVILWASIALLLLWSFWGQFHVDIDVTWMWVP